MTGKFLGPDQPCDLSVSYITLNKPLVVVVDVRQSDRLIETNNYFPLAAQPKDFRGETEQGLGNSSRPETVL